MGAEAPKADERGRDSGFGVPGLGFRVWGLGVRVSGDHGRGFWL